MTLTIVTLLPLLGALALSLFKANQGETISDLL